MKDKSNFALYSRCVKAGKRFYYIDAKRDSKGNDYMVITESNNAVEDGAARVRHKVFLYREDFAKFTEAFLDVLKSFEQEGCPSEEQAINISDMERKLTDIEAEVVDRVGDDAEAEPDGPLKIDFEF